MTTAAGTANIGKPTATVGILYPGYSAEDDYPIAERLLGDDVALAVVHTEMPVDAHQVDALLEIGGDALLAAGAAKLIGAQSIIWACTSGSFVFGWDGAKRQVAALAEGTGLPASSTSFAFVDALAAVGVTRVAVAATYPRDIAELFVSFLRHAGIEVVRLASRGIVTASEVGFLSAAQLFEFAEANDHPDAQALLLPDTALHTIASVAELERQLGKPVLTANQVSVWQGLRLAGMSVTHAGLGALFWPQQARGSADERVG
jgi:maleate cis-trans isomerase